MFLQMADSPDSPKYPEYGTDLATSPFLSYRGLYKTAPEVIQSGESGESRLVAREP
jgi:hypothetical protein